MSFFPKPTPLRAGKTGLYVLNLVAGPQMPRHADKAAQVMLGGGLFIANPRYPCFFKEKKNNKIPSPSPKLPAWANTSIVWRQAVAATTQANVHWAHMPAEQSVCAHRVVVWTSSSQRHMAEHAGQCCTTRVRKDQVGKKKDGRKWRIIGRMASNKNFRKFFGFCFKPGLFSLYRKFLA